MRFSVKISGLVALALSFGLVHALPQGPGSGGPFPAPSCPSGQGLYTKSAGATPVCTDCSAMNRETLSTGACGACNVRNSVLDATTGACLCGASDKGRINGACTPCGVNNRANGDRITCSPCIVGAQLDSAGSCVCNSDKGYDSATNKCVMCVSLGRKNGGRPVPGTNGQTCGACIDSSKVIGPGSLGACITAPAVPVAGPLLNGGFEERGPGASGQAHWTLSGNSASTETETFDLYSHSGNNAYTFGSPIPIANLCQTLPGNIALGSRTLSFYTAKYYDERPNQPIVGGFSITVSVDGTQIFSTPELRDDFVQISEGNPAGWKYYTYNVPITTTGVATLCINSWKPYWFYWVDDVSFA